MGEKPVDKWRPWTLMSKEDVLSSPSFLEGMTLKAEQKTYKFYNKILRIAGMRLSQNMEVLCAAQMYFQRYYAYKTFHSTSPMLITMAAMFVASKAEMKPCPLIHVIKACWDAQVGLAVESLKKKAKGMYNAEYWRQYEKKEVAVIRDPDVYEQLYELVCSAERSLLYTTNFQFNILNAFHALIQTNTGLRKIDHPEMKQFMAEIDLLDKLAGNEEEQVFLQSVWNFLVTIYDYTRLSLQYDPRTIGVACYELACRVKGFKIPKVNGELWWSHVAKANGEIWGPDVGNEQDIRKIQIELSAFYKASDGQNHILAFLENPESVGNGANIVPSVLPSPGISPPQTSAHPFSQPSPGQTSSQTQDERLYGQNNHTWTPGISPPMSDTRQGQNASHPAIPPNLGNTINGHQAPPSVESWNSSVHGFPPNNVNPPLPQETPSEEKLNLKREREDEPNNTITNENPPAEKRRKSEDLLVFDPSAEFSISPDRKPDQNLPTLESKESGELDFGEEEPPNPVSQDVLKARLEKAKKNFGPMPGNKVLGKETHINGQEEINNLDDDLDVRFSP